MFNRFEQFAPMQFNLPKIDLGVLNTALDAKQKRFDAGYDVASKLDTLSIDGMDADRARANSIQNEWQTRKQKIVDSYNGDYAAAYRDITALAKDINREISPGGEAFAISQNKKNYVDWLTTTAKDKEVNPETLNLANSYYLQNYKGVGQKDPTLGTYNTLQPEQLIGYTNPDDVVLKAIKELHPDKYSMERDSINGKWIVRDKQSGERLGADEVTRVAYRALANDKNFANSLKQTAKFKGEDPNQVGDFIMGLAQSYGADYSYDNITEDSRTMKGNDVWMHDDTERNKKAAMQQINQFYYGKGTLDYGAISGSKDLSLSDLAFPGEGKRSTYERDQGIGYFIGKRTELENAATKDQIEKMIDSGEFSKAGFNASIMREVIKNNPTLKAKDLITSYNEAKKEAGNADERDYVRLGASAQKALTEQVMQGKDYLRTNVYVVENPGEAPVALEGQKKEEYMAQFYDKKTGKYIGPWLDGPTNATVMEPSFHMPLPSGGSVFIGTPPSYANRFEDVTALSNAKHSPRGEAMVPSLVEPHPYYANAEDMKNNKISFIPTNVPIRNKVETTSYKDPNTGKYKYKNQEIIQIYDDKLGAFKTLKVAGIDGSPTTLSPSAFELFRKERAIQDEFGKLKTLQNRQTMEFNGNVYPYSQ